MADNGGPVWVPAAKYTGARRWGEGVEITVDRQGEDVYLTVVSGGAELVYVISDRDSAAPAVIDGQWPALTPRSLCCRSHGRSPMAISGLTR